MKKRYIALGLVIIILFGGIFGGILSSNEYSQCISNSGHRLVSQSPGNKNSNANVSIVNDALIYRDCVGEFAHDNGESITGLATILLSIVTCGLVWFGFIQSDITRKQLRAYIAVDEMEDSVDRGIERRATGDTIFTNAFCKNFGETPAINVIYVIQMQYLQGVPTDEIFPKVVWGQGNTLQPSQSTTIRVESKMSTEDWDAMRQGFGIAVEGKFLFVFGFVSYFDIFGSKHFTRFCFHINWNNVKKEIPGWDYYDRYNDIDEQAISHLTRLLETPFRWGINAGSIKRPPPGR